MVRPNSFVSADNIFVYHLGICDYTHKFDQLGCISRRRRKTAETYGFDLMKYINKFVLVSQIDDSFLKLL